MTPALLWMEHVLGFERFWKVAVPHQRRRSRAPRATGSGLKSVVMWDPHSPVKFANNEPLRPFFKDSQINIFNEEHRGDGVQHVALTVGDIIGDRARHARERRRVHADAGHLLRHAARAARGDRHRHASTRTSTTLRELEILVDGEAARTYLLQIFLKESATTSAIRTPGRSSSRSSSARDRTASAPATSARCSRASSGSSARSAGCTRACRSRCSSGSRRRGTVPAQAPHRAARRAARCATRSA